MLTRKSIYIEKGVKQFFFFTKKNKGRAQARHTDKEKNLGGFINTHSPSCKDQMQVVNTLSSWVTLSDLTFKV